MKNNSKIAAAIFAGLAAGAAVWYFMDSDGGKKRWNNLVGDAKKLGKDLKQKAESTANDLQDIASNVADYVHNKKNETKAYVATNAAKGVNLAKDTAQDVSDFVAKS